MTRAHRMPIIEAEPQPAVRRQSLAKLFLIGLLIAPVGAVLVIVGGIVVILAGGG
jgi:hypothetical protein